MLRKFIYMIIIYSVNVYNFFFEKGVIMRKIKMWKLSASKVKKGNEKVWRLISGMSIHIIRAFYKVIIT